MNNLTFTPFDGESSITIGSLTIESQKDKIVIYGGLEIKMDADGQKAAEILAQIFHDIAELFELY